MADMEIWSYIIINVGKWKELLYALIFYESKSSAQVYFNKFFAAWSLIFWRYTPYDHFFFKA